MVPGVCKEEPSFKLPRCGKCADASEHDPDSLADREGKVFRAAVLVAADELEHTVEQPMQELAFSRAVSVIRVASGIPSSRWRLRHTRIKLDRQPPLSAVATALTVSSTSQRVCGLLLVRLARLKR
jgi:hypothetical protein